MNVSQQTLKLIQKSQLAAAFVLHNRSSCVERFTSYKKTPHCVDKVTPSNTAHLLLIYTTFTASPSVLQYESVGRLNSVANSTYNESCRLYGYNS